MFARAAGRGRRRRPDLLSLRLRLEAGRAKVLQTAQLLTIDTRDRATNERPPHAVCRNERC